MNWFWPWICVCTVTGVFLLMTPFLSILEGCNQVSRVYGIQLGQGIAGRVVTWTTMFLGGGLWAPVSGRSTGSTVTILYVYRRYGRFFSSLLRDRFHNDDGLDPDSSRDQIDWREEIWPLQWKFALTWIGGYLLHALFTPVLFAFHGAVVAGQMGMTLALVSMLTSVSYAIFSTKIPLLAQRAARKEFDEMDRLFQRVTLSSMLAAGIGAVGIWITLYGLTQSDLELARRFLSPFETGVLLIAAFVQQLRYAMGAYLRAHKEEPFLQISLIEGGCAVIGLFLLGRSFGALGMALGFLAITLVMIVPAVMIFQRKRRRWRSLRT